MNPFEKALRAARTLLDLGYALDQVIQNPLIAPELRRRIREEIERDQNFPLLPARMLLANPDKPDWIRDLDRSNWYYWPALRAHLLSVKGWNTSSVRSLDDSSDKIIRQLAPPTEPSFDVRGLVLGFVQSGKTANYTAVIAKAADAGYRLIIVLSGIDNGLRRQTNVRLKQELIGYPDNRHGAVPFPPMGKQWHEFTSPELNGDFRPGFASSGALQGSQPVLLVVKKNGPVLRRLGQWLDVAPADVRRDLPVLVIDDEADQASVDTRGVPHLPGADDESEYEPPSIINGLIRGLLARFQRHCYIAYTATPFANILIPHDVTDPTVGNDLYPKDFMVDLPKPAGYFGAEDIFGRMDGVGGEYVGGLDIIRHVTDEDIAAAEARRLPDTLKGAVLDFILAGAARSHRFEEDFPATMLVHTGVRIEEHSQLAALVQICFSELKDDWRYNREHWVREALRSRWETEFRPIIRHRHLKYDVNFAQIETRIGPFIEDVQVREVNSSTGEVLDYEREPYLKAIAVGGNRLSRGLTLEGLMTSYFIRRSASYDTLMQMGRWFGFRAGYEDLTRIYTTSELEDWFSDLAFVEHQLRRDIEVYESQGLTPSEVGMRIWQHPSMQVTSALKRRYATTTTISQSYAETVEQTFKFPLRRADDLLRQAEHNKGAVRSLVRELQAAVLEHTQSGPLWKGVNVDRILTFFNQYEVDEQSRTISIPLITAYIQRMRDAGELLSWTIAVRGREKEEPRLGTVDWDLPTGPVNQISRTRIGDTESVGVITSPGDEACGLPPEAQTEIATLVAAAKAEGRTLAVSVAARRLRPATEGLLLLYPISRYSGHGLSEGGNRRPLFENPRDRRATDLVGLAVSFPRSGQPQHVEAYLQGTVGWRPVQ